MKRQEFRELIQYLEAYSKESRFAYKAKVFALASLGYLYIFLVIGGLIALASGLLFIVIFASTKGGGAFAAFKLTAHLLIPLGILIFMILRAFWVNIPPPQGRPLLSEEAPELHALVNELQEKLQTPVIHEILLTPDFNAGIQQWPRLGVLGWYKNFLLIGIPLFAGISREQLTAVLTHEFGHLSGQHGYFSVWVYRLRTTWGNLLLGFQQEESRGSFLVLPFINWFAPYFDAYAFVIGREHEYEADRLSARIVGPKIAGEALIATTIMARYQDQDYWTKFRKEFARQSSPPNNSFSNLQNFSHEPPPQKKCQLWFEEAMRIATDCGDTHPSLADRLHALSKITSENSTALSFSSQVFKPNEPSALEFYLKNKKNLILNEFDEFWVEMVKSDWETAHKESNEELAELEVLEKQFGEQQLSEDEYWKYVCFSGRHRGDDVGRSLLVKFLEEYPKHVEANLTLGVLKLEENDPQGEEPLQLVIQSAPEHCIQACEMLWNFWHYQGEDDKAEKYMEMLENHSEKMAQAEMERNQLSVQDTFAPHGLDNEKFAYILDLIGPFEEIEKAYLVRKNVSTYPELPCFILGLVIDRSFWRFTFKPEVEEDLELINKIAPEIEFPGSTLIASLNQNLSPLRQTFDKIPDSLIFIKPKK